MLFIVIVCILLSALFAPLGSILVWQRKAYFSDGLAHACLLASSVSGCFDVPIFIAAPGVAAIFALLVFATKSALASNAAINLISSTMLALGLLLAGMFPSSVNINSLLFGDILSTSSSDLLTLSILLLFVGIICYSKIEDIILISLNPDLAAVRGVNVKRLEIYFLVLLALVLSVSMKIIGALLVTALLMIPSYASVLISSTPIHMIRNSFILSVISCLLGIIFSFYYDFAAAPSIILSCGLVFCITLLFKKIAINS
ncbi:MAG: metal ABC transporter permease [Pseudomonadota bacterium]